MADLPVDAAILGRLIASRYEVQHLCERTSQSSVYRAYQRATDCAVLLRVLPARPGLTREACRRALARAEQAAALPTPHVARSLDVGLVAGRWPFVISEFSRGRTLEAVVDQTGPLGLRRVLPLARQIASTLQLAHGAGLTHGGLALDNFWVESLESRPEWLRVMGFGVSELPGSDFEGPTSGVFMSAGWQREAGALDRSPTGVRADIHAFGASLYHLANGSAPVWSQSDVAASLDSSFAGAGWTWQRALARGFALIVQRCLYLSPNNNYASMAQVSQDLESLTASDAAITREPPECRAPVTAVHAPARRARVLLGEPKVIVRG